MQVTCAACILGLETMLQLAILTVFQDDFYDKPSAYGAIVTVEFFSSESMRQEGDVVVGGQRFSRQSVGREQEEDSPLLLSGLQEGLHKKLAPEGPSTHSHRHVHTSRLSSQKLGEVRNILIIKHDETT